MNHTEFQRVLELAFADAMDKQPAIAKRKNTIAAVTGGLIQVAQFGAVYTAGLPVWVSVVIGFVVLVAEAVFHATTNATVAPSVYRKVNQAAADRIATEPVQLEPYTAEPVVVPVVPQIMEPEKPTENTVNIPPSEPFDLDALRNMIAENR